MCGGSDTGGTTPPSVDAGAAFATRRSAPVADCGIAPRDRSRPIRCPKAAAEAVDVKEAAAATAAAAAAVAAAAAAAAEAAACGEGAARGAEAACCGQKINGFPGM